MKKIKIIENHRNDAMSREIVLFLIGKFFRMITFNG
jgi:hypothetical protein